jgi:hypothetical protein
MARQGAPPPARRSQGRRAGGLGRCRCGETGTSSFRSGEGRDGPREGNRQVGGAFPIRLAIFCGRPLPDSSGRQGCGPAIPMAGPPIRSPALAGRPGLPGLVLERHWPANPPVPCAGRRRTSLAAVWGVFWTHPWQGRSGLPPAPGQRCHSARSGPDAGKGSAGGRAAPWLASRGAPSGRWMPVFPRGLRPGRTGGLDGAGGGTRARRLARLPD